MRRRARVLLSGAVKLENAESQSKYYTRRVPERRMPKHSKLWKNKPDVRDFEAAQCYLSLIYPAPQTKRLVHALRSAKTLEHTAKDLLRASALPLLPRHQSRVEDDLKRINKGKPLSPVLLIQGDMSKAVPLIIADGYHRVCAVYYYDEDAPIACRLTQISNRSVTRK
jgi:hypothetical protein